MKLAFVVGILSMVGLINATCTLKNTVVVESSELLGTWYEKYALGDPWMSMFHQCIKNDISLGGDNTISKTRSSKLKWFSFFTWKDESSLVNRGTYWEFTSKSLFSSSETEFTILAAETDYLILKSCPDGLFIKETIWVYGKTQAEYTADQTAAIQSALLAADESGLDEFTKISQTSCS